jgi:hypothetical protein
MKLDIRDTLSYPGPLKSVHNAASYCENSRQALQTAIVGNVVPVQAMEAFGGDEVIVALTQP